MALTDAMASLFGSLGTGLLNFGATALTNQQNRQLTQQQNEFNANESRLNREFQAQQAQIARDWQEEQYNRYSSPSAMVQQYKDAGLNPALMYGQNLQTSTGSSPSPSGSAASGSAIPMQVSNMTGLIQDFLGLAKLKQEIAESKSREAANYSASAKSSSDIQLNSQSIRESQQRISKLIAETRNEEEKRGLIIAQQILAEKDAQLKSNQSISLSFDNLEKQWRQEFKEKFGAYPADNAYQAVQKLFDVLTDKLNIFSIFNK